MEQVYTIKETMGVLKISRAYLYRLITEKKIKPVKLGSRSLFKESELARFIDALGAEETE